MVDGGFVLHQVVKLRSCRGSLCCGTVHGQVALTCLGSVLSHPAHSRQSFAMWQHTRARANGGTIPATTSVKTRSNVETSAALELQWHSLLNRVRVLGDDFFIHSCSDGVNNKRHSVQRQSVTARRRDRIPCKTGLPPHQRAL